MDVKTKRLKRVDLITVSGRVDGNSAPQLEATIKELLQAGRYRIVADLSGVEFISSAGLKALISGRNEGRKFNRGDLVLTRVPPRIRGVLELTGLDHVFKTYDDPVEAVGSF